MRKFSDIIKEIMDEHGVKVTDISEICKCSRTTVYLWINGESCPSFDQAMMLIGELEYNIYCFPKKSVFNL
jgi:predicted transcriptional regulator